jgi:LuxR family quorum sensing-dependent transcriptional regulator
MVGVISGTQNGPKPRLYRSGFESVEVCEILTSVEECMNAIRLIVADLGFSSFILTGLPLLNRPLEPLVLLAPWPGGWMERYSPQNYFEVNPVGQNVLSTSFPFLWSDALDQRDKSLSGQMLGEGAEFGLRDGFCVPIHGATGWQSAFSFAHDGQIDASPGELVAAHLLALTAYTRLRILHGEEPHARKKLTPREREVLTWAAAGKSAWETSALLRRIAAYTVVLKRQLKEEDFKALKTLRPFLKATDRLMAELGYQDEQ